MDNTLIEELSPYSGLININLITCYPSPDLVEDIEVTHIKVKNKKEIINHGYDKINEIFNEHKSNGKKIIVYCAEKSDKRKLENKCKTYSEDIFSSDGDDNEIIKKDKLKTLNIFVNKGTTGLDDKEIKTIIILRDMNDTSNTRPSDYRVFSSLLTQMIGRVRESGGNAYFITNRKIEQKNIKDSIFDSLNHICSDYSYNLFACMLLLNNSYGIYDNTNIESFMKRIIIPSFINVFIRDDYKDPLSTSSEDLLKIHDVSKNYLNLFDIKFDINEFKKNIPTYKQYVDDLFILYQEFYIECFYEKDRFNPTSRSRIKVENNDSKKYSKKKYDEKDRFELFNISPLKEKKMIIQKDILRKNMMNLK